MDDQTTPAPHPGDAPESMRRAMADYVRALHQAYLDAAAPLPPGERGRLPLVSADDVTVLAVGTRYLHVLATRDLIPPPTGPEVEVQDHLDGLTWRLRFFDPVVVPALGLIDESEGPRPDLVQEVLGVRTVVYHLTVSPGGGLTPHHALHAGTGLAHTHAAAARDFDTIRHLAGGTDALVAEMRGAEVAGLPRAQLLLARAIAPGCTELSEMDVSQVDPVHVRRTLLSYLRASTP
jgi:hypothetical protein